MVSLGDICHDNGGACPACGSSKMVKLEHLAVLQCNYCMIRFSEELMLMDRQPEEIANVIHELKRTWAKRLEVTNSMSTDALYEILVKRGVLQNMVEHIGKTNLVKDIYAPMINENMEADLIFLSSNSKLNIDQPKPWSYEEAAASEFNIDEGTGLQ